MPSGKPSSLGSIPIRSMTVSQSGRRRLTPLRREVALSHPPKTEWTPGDEASCPYHLTSRAWLNFQQLLVEADMQRLAKQILRRRPSRIAVVLAGLLYGLAVRLPPALPSLRGNRVA
jgi:hypothetical protein